MGTKNSKSKNEINHKELLTLSNLTNLEWEFVELYDETTGSQKNNIFLTDLLTPESFARRNEEGEIEEYSYIEGASSEEEITQKKIEQGLAKMREEAGIAMEYQEKDTEEGDFLENWEVIYGADNYKVIEDYLDHKWETLCDHFSELDPDEKLYPTREEIKEKKRWQATIQFAVDRAGEVLSILGAPTPEAELTTISNGIDLKGLTNKFAAIASKEYASLALTTAFVFNLKQAHEILDEGLEQAGKELTEKELLGNITEEIENKYSGAIPQEVKFNENLDMRDTGFRVVAFRKKREGDSNRIVIAYKGGDKSDQQGLPREFELLQLAAQEIKRRDPGAEINFTGHNEGADLSFLGTLLEEQRNKYIVEKGDTLSEIAQDLFGSGQLWRDKLEKKDGSNFKEDEDIYPGQEIYYYGEQKIEEQAALFYTSQEGPQEYLYFQPEKIGQEYKPYRKIVLSEIKGAPEKFASRLFIAIGIAVKRSIKQLIRGGGLATISASSLLLYALKAGLTVITINIIVDSLAKWLGELIQRDIYKDFEKLDLISEQKGKIKGYITDDFLNSEGIKLKARKLKGGTPKSVKIETNQAIYIILNELAGEDLASETSQLILREEQEAEDFLLLSLGSGWIKFVKRAANDEDVEVYTLKSFIPSQSPSPIDTQFNETTGQTEYTNSLEEIEEWELASLRGIKQELFQLKKKFKSGTGLTASEETRLYNLKEKKQMLAGIQKEINKGETFANLMKIIADMQRNYNRKEEEIFNFIYPVQSESNSQKNKPAIKIANQLPAQGEVREVPSKPCSEFFFLPYVNENGKLADELPEKYIPIVLKSIFVYINNRHDLKPIKYSSSPQLVTTIYNFHDMSIKQGLLGLMKNGRPEYEQYFNHYQAVLNKLDEDSDLLEDYYQVEVFEEEDEEEESNPSRFEADGIITIDPVSDSSMEYKYNCEDKITGGEVEIKAIDFTTDDEKSNSKENKQEENKQTEDKKAEQEGSGSTVALDFSSLQLGAGEVNEQLVAAIDGDPPLLEGKEEEYTEEAEIMAANEQDWAEGTELGKEEMLVPGAKHFISPTNPHGESNIISLGGRKNEKQT